MKPIYQLYEEFVTHTQICKVCGFQTSCGIEAHIRANHNKDITPMWR